MTRILAPAFVLVLFAILITRLCFVHSNDLPREDFRVFIPKYNDNVKIRFWKNDKVIFSD